MTIRGPHQSTGPAAQQWAEALAAWAIPEEILAAAPQSPYGFDVGMFARLADEALDRETPSQLVAREALSDGGSILDVGCVQRLTEHARGRVVVQLTQHHPLSWLSPLWKELHGLDRPDGPTARRPTMPPPSCGRRASIRSCNTGPDR